MLRLESNKLTVLLTSCCVYSMRSHVGSIASSNLWTNIVHALAQSGVINALHADVELVNNGDKSEDASVLVHLLRVSRNHGYVSLCRQLHGYVVKQGFVSESRLSNSLMRFYKGSDSLEDSHKASDEMPEQDTISWNSLVSGYAQSGRLEEGLSLFLELHRSDVFPNEFSFTASLLCTTENLAARSMHLLRDCETWHGERQCRCGTQSIGMSSLLPAQGTINLSLGLWFFHQTPNPDTVTYNELINAFAKAGDFNNAFQILKSLPNPNSSSWNTILTVSNQEKLLSFSPQCICQALDWTEYSLSIVLAAIAALAVVPWGSLIHSCALKLGLDSRVVVASALIDMYSKCGMLKQAELMFWIMPRKNLIAWNATISGYARTGDSTEGIKLFSRLKQERFLKPDRITFLNLLAVCSHCDVPLELTLGYLEMMINEYGIRPSVEHCCSLIRAMVQRGEIWQAKMVIQEFGFGLGGRCLVLVVLGRILELQKPLLLRWLC
ncbi:hypothetical protein DY000_02024827 [Brassica cretica]|uniref:Pentacotripeptide-repeat region of PRORP domain-containing protein n=1 Tax=Brassica cretica TaxID=69181 RepID=A0ABQ7DZL1_BRACR|nr:hypothetical protein DY000_02024827 [Brassica cretica]